MNKYLSLFRTISIIKTIYFNFRAFKFRTAIRFPVIVGNSVALRNIGKIELNYNGKKKIHIGSRNLFNTTSKMTTVWNNLGVVKFNGPVVFYPSVVVYVSNRGVLEFGGNNTFGRDTSILCVKHIEIGKITAFSWNCQVADSDFHFLQNLDTNEVSTRTSSVKIGDRVWIGNRVIIGKGVYIADGCIIGMNSLVTKSIKTPNTLSFGIPAKPRHGSYKRIFSIAEEAELISRIEL